MKIRPLEDKVVIKVIEEESKSSGGIVLMESSKEKPSKGEVVAVGPGKKCCEDKTICQMNVKVGETVIFGKYAGTAVKINNEELLIMSESEIFGVIE